MEWDDLKVFLQIVRLGQIQLAAKALGVDHSTVSRKLARLEERLGVPLFERAARRLRITREGLRLAEAAQSVESIILRNLQNLHEQEDEISGRVRIGAPEGFGTRYLARRLPRLAVAHPRLQIELCAIPRHYSLAAREVDIAITMDKPTSGNLRFRRLTLYELGIYAAPDYFHDRPRPETVADLIPHSWCGYIDELLYTTALDLLRFGEVHIQPMYRTIDVSTQLEAVRSGTMLGVLPCYIGDAGGDLERVLPADVKLRRSYYIVVHEDLARTRRVRLVMEQIEQWIQADQALFVPQVGSVPATALPD